MRRSVVRREVVAASAGATLQRLRQARPVPDVLLATAMRTSARSFWCLCSPTGDGPCVAVQIVADWSRCDDPEIVWRLRSRGVGVPPGTASARAKSKSNDHGSRSVVTSDRNSEDSIATLLLTLRRLCVPIPFHLRSCSDEVPVPGPHSCPLALLGGTALAGVPDDLQQISVTIKAGDAQGSGNIVTRKIGDDTVSFVWTAAHVVDNLRAVRTVVTADGRHADADRVPRRRDRPGTAARWPARR